MPIPRCNPARLLPARGPIALVVATALGVQCILAVPHAIAAVPHATAAVPQQLPRSVVATATSPTTAHLTWAAPAGADDVRWYLVGISPGTTTSVSAASRAYDFRGLRPQGRYTFTVRALHRGGWSGPVGAGPVTLPDYRPVIITAVSGTTERVPTGTRVTVRWNVSATSGTVRWFTVTASPGNRLYNVAATARAFVVPTLPTGVTYRFGVRGLGLGGWGASMLSNPVTVPRPSVADPPSSVGATVTSGVAGRSAPVSVSWTAGWTGGGAVRWHTAFAWPGGHQVSAAAASTSATFSDLEPGVRYSFTVRTLNTVGWSRNSVAASERIPGGVQSVATEPLGALARLNVRTATVTWRAPAFDGHSDLRWYTVHQYPGGAAVSTNSTAATFVNLPSGTAYYYTVQALNGTGWSTAGYSNGILTSGFPQPQRTVAPISTSRYIRRYDLDWMRRAGFADAQAVPSGHRYAILLDIGGQTRVNGVSGVHLSATNIYVTDVELVAAVNSYVDGYATGQRPVTPTMIAVGTNNDNTVSYGWGRDWAVNVINPIRAHAARYAGIEIAGADDIEPGFYWGPADTKQWLAGYLANTPARFVNNGSADGCPQGGVGGTCNRGWTQNDLQWVSGGASPNRILVLPQIYYTSMARQWKYISLAGIAVGRPRLDFGGPLTELTACAQAQSCYSMSGNSAWTALWEQLQSDPRTAPLSLPWSTDLRIN